VIDGVHADAKDGPYGWPPVGLSLGGLSPTGYLPVPEIEVDRLVVRGLSAVPFVAGDCIRVDGPGAAADVDRLTCDAWGGHRGAGVYHPYASTLLVWNAIVRSDGPVCAKGVGTAVTALAVKDSLLWPCGTQVENGVVLGELLSADPRFVDPGAGDYHLLPDSPCIDAGSPSADYCDEPTPNGCRADLGYYGNTPEATPAPGADHCPCE
jgi:hypothetical protein